MYCLHNFGWKPSEYTELDIKEKAVVIEMIENEIKHRPKIK